MLESWQRARARPSQSSEVDMRLLVHWLILALAIGAAAHLVPGVRVTSVSAALIGALVLGLLNASLRPLLLLLTLPVNVLTLGLFTLVVNALTLWAASGLVHGFFIRGFGATFVAALVISIASTLLHWLVNE